MAKDLFDEWSAGIQLANPSSSADFFEKIPTELENPERFTVTPEQIPANPVAPQTENAVAPVPSPETQAPSPEPTNVGPETRSAKQGGKITLEKTSRGWHVNIDPEISNLNPENFYAPNKDELIFSICEAKMVGNKTIHKLKKEKLLGGDEPVVTPPAPVTRNTPKVLSLSADDVYEIKNKFDENPGDAFDTWIKKRFGLDPEEFAEALKSAPEAKKIAEAQKVKADIDEVNAEFIGNNPDYAEHYSTEENARTLVVRMAKVYLGRKIVKNTPQSVVDDSIFEMYQKGVWTPENLETAKDELIESGLFHRSTPVRRVSEPTPSQPAAPATAVSPSEPEASRIAAKTGRPVGLGIPARASNSAASPEEKPLADVDLQTMPLDKLRALAALQVQMLKQSRQ